MQGRAEMQKNKEATFRMTRFGGVPSVDEELDSKDALMDVCVNYSLVSVKQRTKAIYSHKLNAFSTYFGLLKNFQSDFLLLT